MGLYRSYVLPHVINLAMKNAAAAERRAKVVPKAAGSVLEIGIGSGLNLPFYTLEVSRLRGVDPSDKLLSMASRKVVGLPFPVDLACELAEELSAESASFDTVLTTWTLCSIAEPLKALREMKRVLKPDGRLLFVEHGHAPDPSVQKWQSRINPIWKRFTGGCHVNRKIDDLIREAGFNLANLETGYLPGARFMTFTFEGVANPEN